MLHFLIGVNQFVDHSIGNDSARRQVFGHDIAHASHRLTADTHIDLRDFCVKQLLQFLLYRLQALGCLVDVVNYTFADECRRRLFDYSQHRYAAVKVLLTRNTCHF